MDTPYRSAEDTLRHARRVAALLAPVVADLAARMATHDESKLHPPEVDAFDRMTPRLAGSTYGTDDYRAALDELGPALDHHYAHNPHHPEHHRDGIAGMTLMDLLEALADWRAAGERHADGSMARSLEVNRTRFGIGDQLAGILERTAEALGWLDPSPSARLAANPGLVAAIERTVASPSSRSGSGCPERA